MLKDERVIEERAIVRQKNIDTNFEVIITEFRKLTQILNKDEYYLDGSNLFMNNTNLIG